MQLFLDYTAVTDAVFWVVMYSCCRLRFTVVLASVTSTNYEYFNIIRRILIKLGCENVKDAIKMGFKCIVTDLRQPSLVLIRY